MEIPLLQTKAWQALQDSLGKSTFFEKNVDFSYLAILERTKFGSYLYLPYGPITETESGLKNALKSLENLATAKNAIFIRIEPQNLQLENFLKSDKNFKKSTDLNPKETWVLDLSGSDIDLKNRLPSRLFRYYKNRAKSDLSIETSQNPDDIKYLIDLQNSLAKSKKIGTFAPAYLRAELAQDFATLYLLKHKHTVVAAGLVFDDDTTRYNLQGAQAEDFRKFHATGILTIQLILDAKEKGLKTFDFWGIAPDDAPKDHPWAGFTAFKKSFAGTAKTYCGTYDYVLNPQKYRFYSLLRKTNRLLRKIKH